MAEFYVTQEKAMAPGIAGDWPRVIPKPDSPHGRLVKVEGIQEALDNCKHLQSEVEQLREELSRYVHEDNEIMYDGKFYVRYLGPKEEEE